VIIPKPLSKNGNMTWEVTQAPTVEPITVAELKTFARIDGTDEDTLLGNFITSARQAAELYLRRALLRQTIVVSMNFWPGDVIKFPSPPLIDVLEVRTVDESDVETVYASTNYYVRTNKEPGELVINYSATHPDNTSNRQYGGYQVEISAGYGEAITDVPQLIRDGIKLWAASIYENRTISKEPPPEVKSMLHPYRVIKV
jgi:uncharacterized phiE125 gp8 family phage protein